MKKGSWLLGTLGAITIAGALSGCVVRSRGSFVVDSEPPPPQVEVQTEVRANSVWVKGRWQYENNRWVWQRGYWETQRQGYAWVDGRWEQRGHQWHWVPGHWAGGGYTGGEVTGGGSATVVWEVESEPPAPQEVAPPPQSGSVWIAGRWEYQNNRWVWSPGRWESQRQGQIWVDGRWERRGNKYVYLQGEWRSGGTVVTDVYVGGQVEVESAPPPAQAEPAPPPKAGFIWVSGRWNWQNNRWTWIQGRYEQQQGGRVFVPGRWEQRGKRWVWLEGHWSVGGR